MVASRVFIARHGERIDHVDPSWNGAAKLPDDPFLTDRGLSQARCLGRRLAEEGISKIFVSPFYRTIQTAAAVAEYANISMHIEPGICEGLLKEWFPRGRPALRRTETIIKEFPRVQSGYVPVLVPDYPETKEETILRVQRATKKLVERETGTILLVGHGITCESSARELLGVDSIDFIDYCALMEVVQTEVSDDLKFKWAGTTGPDVSFIHEKFRPNGVCPAIHARATTHVPRAKGKK